MVTVPTAPKHTLIQIPQVVVLESAPRGNISLLKTQVKKFSEVFKDGLSYSTSRKAKKQVEMALPMLSPIPKFYDFNGTEYG